MPRKITITTTSCEGCPLCQYQSNGDCFVCDFGIRKIITDNVENKTFHHDCLMVEESGNVT